MQPTASFAGEWRFLAGGAFACLGIAPLTLPIWAKEPRSDVAFHNAQISTVHGVLLYPILGGMARLLYLGPWDMSRHQPPYDPPKLLLFEAEGTHVPLACASTQKRYTLSFCSGICSGLIKRFFLHV